MISKVEERRVNQLRIQQSNIITILQWEMIAKKIQKIGSVNRRLFKLINLSQLLIVKGSHQQQLEGTLIKIKRI
jgi:hypothetical protein